MAHNQQTMMDHILLRTRAQVLSLYPSYPTWQARWDKGVQRYYPGGGGVGPSGVNQQGDDDEEEEEAETNSEDEDYDGGN